MMSHGRRHPGTAGVTAVMAIAAWAGAIGLVGGGIDFGPIQETVRQRVPFNSLVFAGLALVLVVAGPMSAAAVASWRGSIGSNELVVTAGLLLVGWILVQLAVVREYFWLQPVCLAYGLAVTALGAWNYRRDRVA